MLYMPCTLLMQLYTELVRVHAQYWLIELRNNVRETRPLLTTTPDLSSLPLPFIICLFSEILSHLLAALSSCISSGCKRPASNGKLELPRVVDTFAASSSSFALLDVHV